MTQASGLRAMRASLGERGSNESARLFPKPTLRHYLPPYLYAAPLEYSAMAEAASNISVSSNLTTFGHDWIPTSGGSLWLAQGLPVPHKSKKKSATTEDVLAVDELIVLHESHCTLSNPPRPFPQYLRTYRARSCSHRPLDATARTHGVQPMTPRSALYWKSQLA